jgi:hypothetical protein
VSVDNKPQFEAYIGASGSGKGVSINKRLRELRPPRLILYDPRDEYREHARQVTGLAQLARDVAVAGKGGFRLRYVPGGSVDLAEAFALVCRVAFAAGDCVLVAEELSDVTKPSWAPPAWRRVLTQGRHQGLHVIGAAQRPALIDKTFLAMCTRIRVFQLGYDADVQTMAKELRCSPEAIEHLVTTDLENGADIQYLEYHRRTKTTIAGEIKVRRGRAPIERTALYVVSAPQKAVAPTRKKRGAT